MSTTEDNRSRLERIEALITKEQKEIFQRAADIQGRSLTDFIVSNMLDAANQIIREHEMIILTKEDQEVFVATLLNPPELNQKVKDAAQQYKQMMGI